MEETPPADAAEKPSSSDAAEKPSSPDADARAASSGSTESKGPKKFAKVAKGVKAAVSMGNAGEKKKWIKPSERKRMEEEARQKAAEEAERKAEEERQAQELAAKKAAEEERRRLEEEKRERERRYQEAAEFLRNSLPEITEKLKPLPRDLEDSDWAVIVRGLWHPEEDIVMLALTAVRAACKNKYRRNQSVFACTKDAMTRVVALLATDDSEDLQNGAASALAALCQGAHRPCQDALSMTGNGMALLAEMLHDESTAQAAALAIGQACHSHRGNQDALAMHPQAAANLLDLTDNEDEELARTAEFAVFWACCGAQKGTKTTWERAQGTCASLEEAGPLLHEWELWPEDKTEMLKAQTYNTRCVKNFTRTSRREAHLDRAARRASARMGLPTQNTYATEANMAKAAVRASVRHGSKMLALPTTPEHSMSDTDLRSASKLSVDYRSASKMSRMSVADLRSSSKMSQALSQADSNATCMIGAEIRSVSKTGFIKPMSVGKRDSICV